MRTSITDSTYIRYNEAKNIYKFSINKIMSRVAY